MIEKYLTMENAAVLMVGMVLGGGVVTWGLTDTSALPPKSAVQKYALEKYRNEIVEKRVYVKSVEQESLKDSNYPSFYKAVYNVTVIDRFGRTGYAEKTVYISKDGLMMFTPEKIRFKASYQPSFFNGSVGEYVEN